MKRKKIVAMGLTAVMLAGTVGGCGSADAKKDVAETEETAAKRLEEIGFHESGFPIVDEQVKMKVFGLTHNTLLGTQEEWNNNQFWTRLEAETNIDFEFEKLVEWGKWVEQANLAFASGELPDIFFKAIFTADMLDKYGSGGQLLPLDEYMEYMPNFSALMEEYPEIKTAITSEDGHIYALPEVTTEQIQRVSANYVVDRVWMEKLGISDPQNTEEFYNMLKAFKEEDPNGNGKQDEIPFSFSGKDSMVALYTMLQFYGMQYGEYGLYLDTDSDEIIFTPETEEFKEMLIFAKKLYDEGLLDPTSFTNTANDVKAKNSQTDTTIGVSYTNSPTLICDGLSANYDGGDPTAVQNLRREDYKFLVPLVADNGKQIITANPITQVGRVAITSACENPEVAARFIDYFYSQEGGAYLWAGVEGENYEYDSDGNFTFIKADGTPAPIGEWLDVRKTCTLQPGGATPCLFPEVALSFDTATKVRSEVAEYGEVPLPQVNFNSDDFKTISSIGTDVSSYVDQFSANVISGKVNIDEEWDNYITTLKNMGSEQLVEMYNSQYEKLYK